jgi:hypothetical protein
MQSTVILLRQNSQEIRDAIKASGIDVCICANFVDSIWLDYCTTIGSVHGIGYPYEDMTSEQTLAFIEYEWKQYNTKVIECKDVQEFINEIKKSRDNESKKSSKAT